MREVIGQSAHRIGMPYATAPKGMLFARRLPDWDRHPPPLGRMMAALSLLLWPAAMVAGRMIAYV